MPRISDKALICQNSVAYVLNDETMEAGLARKELRKDIGNQRTVKLAFVDLTRYTGAFNSNVCAICVTEVIPYNGCVDGTSNSNYSRYRVMESITGKWLDLSENCFIENNFLYAFDYRLKGRGLGSKYDAWLLEKRRYGCQKSNDNQYLIIVDNQTNSFKKYKINY